MSKSNRNVRLEVTERRRHWRDRRTGIDRRSLARLQSSNYDCRSGQPRRAADISGELTDGEVWWNKGITVYE